MWEYLYRFIYVKALQYIKICEIEKFFFAEFFFFLRQNMDIGDSFFKLNKFTQNHEICKNLFWFIKPDGHNEENIENYIYYSQLIGTVSTKAMLL